MKKIFATLLAASLLLIGTQANAQLVPGAGYLYASEKASNSDNAIAHNGFYLGASYNVPIVAGLGVAPGIYVDMLFRGKSSGEGNSSSNYYLAKNYREFAVNVPINVNYKFTFNRNAALMFYAGPTFQVGVISKSTYSGELNVFGVKLIEGSETINYYDKDSAGSLARNRFNMSVGGGIGFQAGDLLFTVGYDRSLLNYAKSDNYTTSRNYIKAGINFAF